MRRRTSTNFISDFFNVIRIELHTYAWMLKRMFGVKMCELWLVCFHPIHNAFERHMTVPFIPESKFETLLADCYELYIQNIDAPEVL